MINFGLNLRITVWRDVSLHLYTKVEMMSTWDRLSHIVVSLSISPTPRIIHSFVNCSRRYNQSEFTNKVVTLWYRCPELLLGATRYDEKVDIWSAGCILAELLIGKALFSGKTDMEQLQLIFNLLGTPDERSWEGLSSYVKIRSGEIEIDPKSRPSKLRDKYGGPDSKIPLSALGLIERMLEMDPKKRVRAGRALDSHYFLSHPVAPENPADLGTINVGGDSHEFQTKPIRKEAKAAAQKASAEAKALGKDEKDAYDSAYQQFLSNAVEARQTNEPFIVKTKAANPERPIRDPGRSCNVPQISNPIQTNKVSTIHEAEAANTATTSTQNVELNDIPNDRRQKEQNAQIDEVNTDIAVKVLFEPVDNDCSDKLQRQSDEHESTKRSQKYEHLDSGKLRDSKKSREKDESLQTDKVRGDVYKYQVKRFEPTPKSPLALNDSDKIATEVKEVERDAIERKHCSDDREDRKYNEHKQKKEERKRHKSRDPGKSSIDDDGHDDKIADTRKDSIHIDVIHKSGFGTDHEASRKEKSVDHDLHGDKIAVTEKRRDRSSERRRDKSKSHKRHRENLGDRDKHDKDKTRRYSYDERPDARDRASKNDRRPMDEGEVETIVYNRANTGSNHGVYIDARDRMLERNEKGITHEKITRDGRYEERTFDNYHGSISGRFSSFHEPGRSMNYEEDERKASYSVWNDERQGSRIGLDDERRSNVERDRPPNFGRFSQRYFGNDVEDPQNERERNKIPLDDSRFDKYARNIDHMDEARYPRDRKFFNDNFTRDHNPIGNGNEYRETRTGRDYVYDRKQSGHRDPLERRVIPTYDRPNPPPPVDDKWGRERSTYDRPNPPPTDDDKWGRERSSYDRPNPQPPVDDKWGQERSSHDRPNPQPTVDDKWGRERSTYDRPNPPPTVDGKWGRERSTYDRPNASPTADDKWRRERSTYDRPNASPTVDDKWGRERSSYDRPNPQPPVEDKWGRERSLNNPLSRKDEASDKVSSYRHTSDSSKALDRVLSNRHNFDSSSDQDYQRRDRDLLDRQSGRRSHNHRGRH